MSDPIRTHQRRRLFISYRHVEPDQTVARQVADALGKQHAVFIDQKILPGYEWDSEIEGGLQTAEFFIAFLSEPAAKSPGVVTEIETAHYRNVSTGTPVIVPVRLGFEAPLRYPLSVYVNRFQYILWRDPGDTALLIRELTEVIAKQTEKTQIEIAETVHPVRPVALLGRVRGFLAPAQAIEESVARRNRLQAI